MMGSSIEQKSKFANTLDSKMGRSSNQSNSNLNNDPYAHLKARNLF